MYLVDLSDEQKRLFLDFSVWLMESKGHVDQREKILLKQYCDEMKIVYESKKSVESSESILQKLKEISSFEELKKITVEIVALIYADEEYENEEYKLLMQLQAIFEFDIHLLEEIIFATRHMLLSYKMVEKIVK